MHKIRIWSDQGEEVPLSATAGKDETARRLHLSLDGVEISQYIQGYSIEYIDGAFHKIKLTLIGNVEFGKEGDE